MKTAMHEMSMFAKADSNTTGDWDTNTLTSEQQVERDQVETQAAIDVLEMKDAWIKLKSSELNEDMLMEKKIRISRGDSLFHGTVIDFKKGKGETQWPFHNYTIMFLYN
eukprot:SAG31_NODE_6852_length_1870_cov_1.294749_2_plen_109_part_00